MWPRSSTLGYISDKKKKSLLIHIHTCAPMFIAVLLIEAQIQKQPKCSWAEGWIKKIYYVHTIEYYSAIKNLKKEQNNAICGNVGGLQFSCSVVSDSLWPHGPQHARPPCPSPTPGACLNSCMLSRWCHPTISSSVMPSNHLILCCSLLLPPSIFPRIRVFSSESLFASGGQSIYLWFHNRYIIDTIFIIDIIFVQFKILVWLYKYFLRIIMYVAIAI